ncbi:MAG TPA: PepSY domain-containing protein, partial [Hyphomicrobiaceae bacterium]|nr:PepSY domain-containing protein [Hyphomicrobiaceae bacterium]
TTPGIPWTLEPASAPQSHHHQGGSAIDVGAAGRIFASNGLTTAYRLIYPRDAHDVYTAYTYPDQPEGQRTIHIDQYSGAVLNDVRFADYGGAAKAVEWGVALHMGNYFGAPNQIVMLLAAVGAAALSVTGPLMWILRRRKGLAAPEPFAANGFLWGFAAFLLALGLLFPAMGMTILLVLILERVCLRRIPVVRQWLVLAP